MITLNSTHPNGEVRKAGGGTYEVPSGKSLKIETSPDGEEIADLSPPKGKKWETVNISIQVCEVDA